LAYYDALIAAWNNATQPPPGVTGTGLNGSMTTAQKLATVNAWTIVGTIPAVLNVTGAQVLNCINWAEFNALTATQQANILALCNIPGLLLGGSSNTAFMLDGMLLAYFTNHSGPTITALTALAQSSITPWWQTGAGLTSPVTAPDLLAAGGLT
jgi:hypothetical protein